MSLQLVAQHLAEKGRGPDSTLVHMSNKEVAGLNALARKHGGQLSVNPSTGLPEAGFLDNILPMVAGGALTAFTGIEPMTAAGIVGGITALDSKDLSKGLVAGLGAYGGGSLAGGLMGLGANTIGSEAAAANADWLGPVASPSGEAARQSAMANASAWDKLSTGAGQLVSSPGQTLATMGGGSMIRGGLPILAGLAPAIAEEFDNQDEGDGAPAQHKGYIRKYAFDPVTGQYKQVGAYEAGGDPNVDVSGKAGTAGAYGGVRQSEYEAAQGMADGGSTSDSSRIYDYLMGRGPNPMQFTHTAAPQVDYNVNKTPVPITPTTPILEPVYDPYGNIQRGGNYDAEKHAADLEARNDYLSVDGNDMTLNKYFDLPAQDRKDLDDKAAKASPIRYTVGEVVKLAAPGRFLAQGLDAAGNFVKSLFPKPVDLNQSLPMFFDPLGNVRHNPVTNLPMTSDEAAKAELGEQIADTNAKAYAAYSPPQGDPAQQAAVRDAINNTDFSGMDRGGGRASSGDNNGGGGGSLSNQSSDTRAALRSNEGYGGGSGDAQGGYLQHGQFDQRMARGGLPAPHAFYRQGKFGYKGPQVYADGGIAALAQRYDDGGMTLPLKAQPIKNLGSMHPKSLQAAYDHAVATNDVAGARKYQNELGLRNKLQNVQMYADGGEAEHYNLGSYSDGGRLLKGPGDGVSDDIPATIGHGQPARLADGEFVIPARIVSEIGNGSTDAGARELYKMMDRIQAGRAKTVGKDQVARNSKAVRHLPA